MPFTHPPIPREKSRLVLPACPSLPNAATGATRELPDGRGELLLNGEPSGIFPSQAAADAGLETYKRMGIAR